MKQLLVTLFLAFLFSSAYSQANTKLSNLVAPTAVNQHLLPNSTNARDLGTRTLAWRNLHLRGDVYLDGTRFVSNAPGTTAFNAFVGSNAGVAVTSGKYNTAIGDKALFKDTSGSYNTALGVFALYANTSGGNNSAVGSYSMYRNTTGRLNLAAGDFSLYSNTTGNYNTALGPNSLYSNTTGQRNTAMGYASLVSNTTGQFNTASGAYSLYTNSTGLNNTAVGYGALLNNNSQDNTAVGYSAGANITSARYNTAVGSLALNINAIGWDNTAVGFRALYGIVGDYNTAVGFEAGQYASTRGTFVGKGAYSYPEGLDNVTTIGFGAVSNNSNSVRLGNFNVTSIGGQVAWTAFSDCRYKQNINEDVQGLDFINSLRPITYTVNVKGLNAFYNKGKKQLERFTPKDKLAAEQDKAEAEASKIVYNGFVAQEVEKAAKKLNYEFSGVDKPQTEGGLYGLRYSDFVVPLVKAVQELSKENEELKKKVEEVDELKRQLAELKALVTGNSGTTVNLTSAYLEQNIPNPTGGTTSIRYHVPTTATSATMTLTNAKGQVVKTISLGSRGIGQVNLSTTMLAAGTYNYTLYVDGRQVDIKRLVVTK